MHGKVVDPAAVTVEAGHRRADSFAIQFSHDDGRAGEGKRSREVRRGVVPRPRQLASVPQRNHRRFVGGCRLAQGDVHPAAAVCGFDGTGVPAASQASVSRGDRSRITGTPEAAMQASLRGSTSMRYRQV